MCIRKHAEPSKITSPSSFLSSQHLKSFEESSLEIKRRERDRFFLRDAYNEIRCGQLHLLAGSGCKCFTSNMLKTFGMERARTTQINRELRIASVQRKAYTKELKRIRKLRKDHDKSAQEKQTEKNTNRIEHKCTHGARTKRFCDERDYYLFILFYFLAPTSLLFFSLYSFIRSIALASIFRLLFSIARPLPISI